MSELTIEITDYCPHHCKFCSSNSVDDMLKAKFISYEVVEAMTRNDRYDHIIISGGEPLAHPFFWKILQLCKSRSDDVVVYSNAITHLIYNPHIIDGVYLEANLTVTPETDKIHILKRVKQGREADRPEVYLSRNHFGDCSCNHRVVRPDGRVCLTPCNKYEEVKC